MRTIDDEKSRLVCFVRGQSSGVRIMKTSFHSLLVVVVVVSVVAAVVVAAATAATVVVVVQNLCTNRKGLHADPALAVTKLKHPQTMTCID